MGVFSTNTHNTRFVALLDIGSASVTVSVACSHTEGEFEVLYSKQERILLKQITNSAETGKHIMSAVMNAMLDLGQNGIAALQKSYPHAHIDVMQVSIAAPWSYTITKNAVYKKEDPFTINKKLYYGLLHSMEQAIADELKEHEVADHLGLRVVSRTVTAMRANGYIIKEPLHQRATELELSLCTAVIQDYLYEIIVDGHNKILPKSELRINSFMFLLYNVLADVHPEMGEFCIINQTLEAIELGIVRSGELQYSTHESYGTISLVRELANVTNSTLDEVYGAIQTNLWKKQQTQYSEEVQEKVIAALDEYQNIVSNLMRQTGDGFTIPKTIYIHTASCSHAFLAPHIESGAVLATSLAHIVHNIDKEILQFITHDTKKELRSCVELISGYYFHTHMHTPSLNSL